MVRERGVEQPIELTPTQAEAGRVLLDYVQRAQGNTLIILEGVSGVGKTSVIQGVKDAVVLNGGTVIEESDIRYNRPVSGNTLVTTSTLTESFFGDAVEDVAGKRFPGIKTIKHVLPGMNEEEATAFASRVHSDSSSLSPEEIARYSLGVPLLAEQMSLPGMTQDAAELIGARFLVLNFRGKRDQFQEALKKYLRIDVPSVVLAKIKDVTGWEQTDVYQDLFEVLSRRKELEGRDVIEESPLFTAQDSKGIYDAMLANEGDNNPELGIFAPQLSSADIAAIQRAFGFEYWSPTEGEYRYDNSSRSRMFGSSWRKVVIWHRDARGGEFQEYSEGAYLNEMMPTVQTDFEEGQIGLPTREGNNPGSFAIHAHDHSGLVHNPVKIGWQVETMLQQRGIPYFVQNELYGQNYVFDPKAGRINFVQYDPKLIG